MVAVRWWPRAGSGNSRTDGMPAPSGGDAVPGGGAAPAGPRGRWEGPRRAVDPPGPLSRRWPRYTSICGVLRALRGRREGGAP
jgi:hypothetical protein